MTNDQNLLRTPLRNARKQLPALRRHLDAIRICSQLLPLIPCNGTVASYLSTAHEVSTHYLNKAIIRKGNTLLTPAVRPHYQLAFVRTGWAPQRRNNYGISESRYTPTRARKLPTGIRIICPLVGFDQQCNRIGMGGGYYDRLLASNKRCHSIGLAFSAQQLRSIPTMPWDQALNKVLTPRRTFKRLR